MPLQARCISTCSALIDCCVTNVVTYHNIYCVEKSAVWKISSLFHCFKGHYLGVLTCEWMRVRDASQVAGKSVLAITLEVLGLTTNGLVSLPVGLYQGQLWVSSHHTTGFQEQLFQERSKSWRSLQAWAYKGAWYHFCLILLVKPSQSPPWLKGRGSGDLLGRFSKRVPPSLT